MRTEARLCGPEKSTGNRAGGYRVTLKETGCAVSLRWEFDVKSEVNGDNFQEVPKKSRGVRTRVGKVETLGEKSRNR